MNDRKELMESLAKELEAGKLPWDKGFRGMRDVNAVTGKAYSGGNVIRLLASARAQGFEDPRWCTFKQAQEQGWNVKRGSKGTRIEFWSKIEDKDKDQESAPKGNERPANMFCRMFYVFNGSQIEGIPPLPAIVLPEPDELRKIAERAAKGMGVQIEDRRASDLDSPFYAPSADKIVMPLPEQFNKPGIYEAVLLHELGHATGHPARLDRDTLKLYGTSIETRAREELVAELTSVFARHDLGVAVDPRGHSTAYLQSWASVIRQDPNALFSAAREADKAVGMIKEHGLEVEVAKAQPALEAGVFQRPDVKAELERRAGIGQEPPTLEALRDRQSEAGVFQRPDVKAELERRAGIGQEPPTLEALRNRQSEAGMFQRPDVKAELERRSGEEKKEESPREKGLFRRSANELGR
jgi:antirestriction protein ArdC